MATYAAYRHVELDNVGYGKKRVLKPPGGGSSDIFGAPPEETSPRRVKNHNHSQLGSALFGDGAPKNNGSSTGTTSPDSPRVNKPGNDSYNRLFGPPDAPSIQNTKNHTRSNISLSGDSHDSYNEKIVSSNGHHPGSNGTAIINGNANTNDNTAFRRNKRFRGSSCMPRNPVTGDGVYVTPLRRSARKSRDGNPVTGTGYTSDIQNNVAPMQNGSSNMNGSDKSSDSSPAGSTKGQPSRTRVPPGGYSSGLW
ncbi:microtubule-associated protein Jupiter [Venturia canescens]|uniref:microtubule-associated protein Jupiter n=1 Tax=Venturia canescens TaxID=32260 RepID=UPI001C9BDA18|nr:microtubule-associated protein Jupiter [Venturia canescens]